ncbi:hypothetical protein [Streptomyces alboflavus]|uniref:hypothetical protein n=1 Tax=Streptomyces alboflavus TaxID=67267 RepID=UPI00369A8D4F
MTLSVLATALLLALTVRYVVKCWLKPFGDCRKCDGMGHALRFDRKGKPKRGKDCRHCDGYGIRVRAGRRLHSRAQRIHRDGTR